jgi:hypothetical protein
VVDFSNVPGAPERQEKVERTRAEARRHYRDHLAAAFDLRGTWEVSEQPNNIDHPSI